MCKYCDTTKGCHAEYIMKDEKDEYWGTYIWEDESGDFYLCNNAVTPEDEPIDFCPKCGASLKMNQNENRLFDKLSDTLQILKSVTSAIEECQNRLRD